MIWQDLRAARRQCRFAARSIALLTVVAAIACANAIADEPAGNGQFATRVRNMQRPHLTVVISIDQFRADYLRRLTDLFLPAKQGNSVGGFRYLMNNGSYFIDARYQHLPLTTGPGHTVIGTGGYPYKTGIVANEWWDKAAQARVYCVDDPKEQVVGAQDGSDATPMGPLNLLSTTVADELKLATGGASRVVTLSLKDRAAILLGGHMQDVCIWFDDNGGRWISSTAYCRDGKLPSWVEQINSQGIPARTLGTAWTPSFPAEALSRTIDPAQGPDRGPFRNATAFSHALGSEPTVSNYHKFWLTPAANDFVFKTAERAIVEEKLGQHGNVPDYLAMNLAVTDTVGHAFGPYSPEEVDITVQADRQLSEFLNFINKTVPGGLAETVVVVTADHGILPVPENLEAGGVNAGRIPAASIPAAVQKALSTAFGGGVWIGKDSDGKTVGAYVEPSIYLNEAEIARALASGKATSRSQIEDVAAQAVAALPNIYACYTRTAIERGEVPDTAIGRAVVYGYYPKISGDVIVVNQQLHIVGGEGGSHGTSHGAPYAYDTHVPILIAGPGIRPGVWPDLVSPADIAPTLCALLGVELPSGCDGKILASALK